MLPSVTVRLTNPATNTSRETKTDASGAYSLPFLPAGDYSLAATLAGFQTQKVDRLTLQVQQTTRVDFQLKVGDVGYVGSKGTRLIVTYPDLNIPLQIVDPRTL